MTVPAMCFGAAGRGLDYAAVLPRVPIPRGGGAIVGWLPVSRWIV
jgi:hypothetical protein